jgi:Na+-transporting NADH:ubiquinone oxidoreductase subunit C
VKRGSLYTLAYAAILGLVCALTLAAVDGFTATRKAANARAEEVRNILAVLDVPVEAGAAPQELLRVFEENVVEEERGTQSFYSYEHPVEGLLRAVRFAGPGLWGPVEGFLCFEEDMRTIFAVTFYRQEETPGLGGEISSPEFTDQFEGLSAVGPDGSPGIRVVGNGADDINEVDAISGATMTSDKVEDMLNMALEEIVGKGGFDG